jgi:hypothetical protein
MSGPDVKSESVDLLKLLQQVSGQLAQITQGMTSNQMSGQRVDRVDTQDIGADEMKSLAGGMASTEALRGVDLIDERQHKANVRALELQVLQNAIETSNMVGKQAVAGLSKGAENLLGVNALDAMDVAAVRDVLETAKKV